MSRTARKLSAEELRAYRPWVRFSAWSAGPGLEDRRRRAWSAAREAAELLRSEYGARSVIAFGSLVTPDRFTPWSDIDLAVEGVVPESFYDAAGAAADLGCRVGLKIDVVDLGACPAELRRRVMAEGKEL